MEETEREQQPEIAAIDLFIRVKPLSQSERDEKKVHFWLISSKNRSWFPAATKRSMCK